MDTMNKTAFLVLLVASTGLYVSWASLLICYRLNRHFEDAAHFAKRIKRLRICSGAFLCCAALIFVALGTDSLRGSYWLESLLVMVAAFLVIAGYMVYYFFSLGNIKPDELKLIQNVKRLKKKTIFALLSCGVWMWTIGLFLLGFLFLYVAFDLGMLWTIWLFLLGLPLLGFLLLASFIYL